jgi:RHS repeat-associated protein
MVNNSTRFGAYTTNYPVDVVQGQAQTLYFVHADHLNTPRLVADATGTTVWRWDQQEPFGNNPADENPSGLGAFDLPLRLPGQRYDKETGLHYNYFRDYDPSIGRYGESDPIGLRGGLNTYAYVGGQPLGLIDVQGLIVTNRRPPHWTSPWDGTQIPGGDAFKTLLCMERCLGGENILISGGSECTLDGRHQPGTTPGSRHCTNQAFDIPDSWVDPRGTNKVLCCAKKCGVQYIQRETTHYHFQTVPGKSNRKNILPPDGDCTCTPSAQ